MVIMMLITGVIVIVMPRIMNNMGKHWHSNESPPKFESLWSAYARMLFSAVCVAKCWESIAHFTMLGTCLCVLVLHWCSTAPEELEEMKRMQSKMSLTNMLKSATQQQ